MKILKSLRSLILLIFVFPMATLQAVEPAKAGAPVAKVGNTVLTEDDMRKEMGMSLYEAENQVYQVKKGWVDQKVKTMLFAQAAKQAGLSVAAWQAREIDGKVPAPTQQEIDQMAARMSPQGGATPPNDAAYAKQKEQAKQYLMQQKRSRNAGL